MASNDLLPRERDEFRTREYWEQFFRKRKDAFEWYGDYDELAPDLASWVGRESRVLVVGCGNSDFSARLYDSGTQSITNVDFSARVIADMAARNRRRKRMQWLEMDMTTMSVEDGYFDVVVDKGALDALASSDSPHIMAQVRRFFDEVERVLVPGGVYICVTLGQDFILSALLHAFPASAGHITTVSTVRAARAVSEYLPLLFAIEKRRGGGAAPAPQRLFFNARFAFNELGERISGAEGRRRVAGLSVDPILRFIDAARAVHRVRSSLGEIEPGRREEFELRSRSDELRYHLVLADTSSTRDQPCGVFIVPHGREDEWLFRSSAGVDQLAESAGVCRLLVVRMLPGGTYGGLEEVQSEIAPAVRDFAPLTARGSRIPIMSVDSTLGSRAGLIRGRLGEPSGGGEYVVDEVVVDDERLRRLVFLDNPGLVQTEVRIGEDGEVERRQLCFPYHRAMVAGLASLQSRLDRVLLVGLGGGALALALLSIFPSVSLTVVELDREVVGLATRYFGLPAPGAGGFDVVVDDGLEVIARNGDAFDAIIVDVDNKDTSIGMSCPPPEFLSSEALAAIHGRLKDRGGLLVVNLAARSQDAFRRGVAAVVDGFGAGRVRQVRPVDDDVNVVLFASTGETSAARGDAVRGELWAQAQQLEDLELDELAGQIALVSMGG